MIMQARSTGLRWQKHNLQFTQSVRFAVLCAHNSIHPPQHVAAETETRSALICSKRVHCSLYSASARPSVRHHPIACIFKGVLRLQHSGLSLAWVALLWPFCLSLSVIAADRLLGCCSTTLMTLKCFQTNDVCIVFCLWFMSHVAIGEPTSRIQDSDGVCWIYFVSTTHA